MVTDTGHPPDGPRIGRRVKAFLEHFAAVVGSVTIVILAMSLTRLIRQKAPERLASVV